MTKFNYNSLVKNGLMTLPTQAILYLTMKCNLKCSMCFQKYQRNNERDLTLEEIKKVISGTTIKSVFLVGGEIFVRKDIIQIMDFFESQKIRVSIITNGTLMTDEIVEYLESMTYLDRVYVSLDGTETLNDAIRGKGSFSKVMNFLRKTTLKERVYINTVLQANNYMDIQQLGNELGHLGIKYMNVQFEMQYTQDEFKESNKALSDLGVSNGFRNDCVTLGDIDFAYLKKLERLTDHPDIEVTITPSVYEESVEHYLNCRSDAKSSIKCKDIIDGVAKISNKGELMICESLSKRYHNLIETPLNDIWNSKEICMVRNALIKEDLLPMCSRCCSLIEIGK